MAQVANNIIYRIDWRGIHTGWDYRIDIIIPPEEYPLGLNLNNPTIISLPIDTVLPTKSSIKYPDYFGASEIPTLDLAINLMDIPEEFAKALTQPSSTYSSSAGNIDAGIVFHLYIKYNNIDTNNPIPYRLVKSYIHYADGKFKYQPKDHTINIQAIDLNFAVLRALSFNQLSYNDFDTSSFSYIVELYSIINSNYYSYYHTIDGPVIPQFKFVKLIDLVNWINEKATIIKRLLTRNESDSFAISITLPKLYKQTGNVDGSEGSQLSISDIYLLAYILLGEDVVGGLFHAPEKQSLQQTYPNSVADFYNELAEFNLRQIKSGVLGLDMNPSYYHTIELDINQIYDVSFSVNEEKIKSVTCSLYESHQDQDTGGDIDKREAALQGSRNEASWTIPVVFNNILTNIKREGDKKKKGYTTLFKNLYYIDQLYGSIDNIIRVHEYAVFELKYYVANNPTSYHIINKPLIPRNYSNTILTALGTQVESGIPELLSKFALRCMKGGTDFLECTTDFNTAVSYQPGGDIGNPWLLNNMHEYTFNLINFDVNNSYLTYLANNWKLIESEIDFIKEIVKCKFIRLKL